MKAFTNEFNYFLNISSIVARKKSFSSGVPTDILINPLSHILERSNTKNVTLYIRNTGGGKIGFDEIFYDGNTIYIAYDNTTPANISRVGKINKDHEYLAANKTSYYLTKIGNVALSTSNTVKGSNIIGNSTITVQGTLTVTVEFASSQTSGTSHTLKIVTSDGGTFAFTIVAGSSS